MAAATHCGNDDAARLFAHSSAHSCVYRGKPAIYLARHSEQQAQSAVRPFQDQRIGRGRQNAYKAALQGTWRRPKPLSAVAHIAENAGCYPRRDTIQNERRAQIHKGNKPLRRLYSRRPLVQQVCNIEARPERCRASCVVRLWLSPPWQADSVCLQEPLHAAHLYVYRVVGGQRAHCHQDIGIQKDAPFGEQL